MNGRGVFTGYASSGGRGGARKLRSLTRMAGAVSTNFALTSYGAAIKALGLEYTKVEEILQSVLMGRPEQMPASCRLKRSSINVEGAEYAQGVRTRGTGDDWFRFRNKWPRANACVV